VPAGLYDKLADEPLIPLWSLHIYDLVLGPALIILGLTLLLGIGTRISLFAMGLLYTSLTFGLILLKQDAGVAWLGVHMVIIMLALMLSKHNRFTILRNW
jgi:thiosulfate dehydrogenase [quinone] large subunit